LLYFIFAIVRAICFYQKSVLFEKKDNKRKKIQ